MPEPIAYSTNVPPGDAGTNGLRSIFQTGRRFADNQQFAFDCGLSPLIASVSIRCHSVDEFLNGPDRIQDLAQT